MADNDIDDDYDIVESDSSCELSKVLFGDITKMSAAKQVTIGGIAGCVSGYLFATAQQSAAIATAASGLMIQLAQHNDLIKASGTRVRRALTQEHARADKEFRKNRKTFIDSVKRFCRDNQYLAAGFAWGSLFGAHVSGNKELSRGLAQYLWYGTLPSTE